MRVTADGVRQLDEVRSGGSYLSQSDLALHFGLGNASRINKLEVMWPGGDTQAFTNIEADRFYTLKQGGALAALPKPALPAKH